MTSPPLQPTTAAEVQAAVRAHPRLLPRAGGSKPALSTPPAATAVLDLSALRGVLEYRPEEYTFTALAGTPVSEVAALLAEHGQYLPCDPPLAARGATLGGTVAAGLSGPGRYRYGGVRDFLLGVQFVDGSGEVVRGGGKVVKNAAGFDLPKLMVGSLGRLGVLVELTFKVFPRPAAYATLQVDYADLGEALEALHRLTTAPLDLEAVDLEPPGRLWLRVGGLPDALPARLDRLQQLTRPGEVHRGPEEETLWREVREFRWVPAEHALVKVPLTPRRLRDLDSHLHRTYALRRYSVAGNLAWLACPEDLDSLDALLSSLELGGLVLFDPRGCERPLLGLRAGEAFGRRVKQALDPTGRFLEV